MLWLALAARGQDTQAQTTPPPDPPPWSVGGIKFSGLVDGYYSLNFNHPASGTNGLRNFDVKANQFSLNMAKLVMEHAPEPIGFRVDLGFGRTFEIVHSFDHEDATSVLRNVEQAYISLKPPKGNGFQFDFGKFVTSAGAEVIETHTNWNYSRSILFAWAIPYYHFGARVTKPVGSHWTGGFQVVNGWNTVEDNNSGKTIGLTSALTSSKASLYNNYYVGPEKVGTNDGYRHLFDTTLVLTPSDKANVYFNVDYGVEKFKAEPSAKWYGVAAAARLAANDWFAVTPRIEWFKDRDGFSTGTAQTLKEFTLTAELKHAKGFFTRLEYRRDWSDTDYFERGNGGTGKNQNTLLVGFVAYFGE
jgi:hypothetical protein